MSMKDEFKKMRSSEFRSSMFNKFMKSFHSKYKLTDFARRSSSEQKMSEAQGVNPNKGTSKYESSSSVATPGSTNKNNQLQVQSAKPAEKRKNRLSVQLVNRNDAD